MADDDSFNENWSDNNAEDDEGTLDEEEAFDGEADDLDEIKMLEEEQDIPLDQLRAMYGFGDEQESQNGEENGSVSLAEDEDDEGEDTAVDDAAEDADAEDDAEDDDDPLVDLIPNAQRLGPRGYFEVNDDEEADVDNDYIPPPAVNLWKRCISVGPNHQAEVPPYDPDHVLGPNDRKNELLWKPEVEDSVLADLIKRVYGKSEGRGEPETTTDFDNDYVLHKFLENGYDVEKTIEQVTAAMLENPIVDCNPAYRTLTYPRTPFSSAETDSFEQALPVYGKNFSAIRNHTLPSRRVGELVEFYYHWKKSERHDVFIEASRQRKINAQEGDPPMLFPVFRPRFGRPSEPMEALILSQYAASSSSIAPAAAAELPPPPLTAENGNHANGHHSNA